MTDLEQPNRQGVRAKTLSSIRYRGVVDARLCWTLPSSWSPFF